MQGEEKYVFRCRGCRQVLFREFLHGDNECTSYFIEKPEWLNIDDLENEIKFKCPKCETKIGEVIFSGKKCSCQKWITPAYQLHKNKIDRIAKLWYNKFMYIFCTQISKSI